MRNRAAAIGRLCDLVYGPGSGRFAYQFQEDDTKLLQDAATRIEQLDSHLDKALAESLKGLKGKKPEPPYMPGTLYGLFKRGSLG
jgi:hypothetical protein